MNQEERERLTALLQSAIPPRGERGLEDDLWPRMRQRLERRRPAAVAWFDLALAGVAAAACLAFPMVIPWVMFQF